VNKKRDQRETERREGKGHRQTDRKEKHRRETNLETDFDAFGQRPHIVVALTETDRQRETERERERERDRQREREREREIDREREGERETERETERDRDRERTKVSEGPAKQLSSITSSPCEQALPTGQMAWPVRLVSDWPVE
jgi:hypothetical protein